MKKLLLGIAALVLVCIAGGLWWVHSSLDAQIASAIRRSGPEITGVRVNLSTATIDPINGKVSLTGIEVGNPDGFKTKHALSLGEITIMLDISSLRTDVIRIKELTLIKPRIMYEYASTGSNLEVLQHHIERSIAQQRGNRKKTPDSESSKKLVIEHLYVKNGTVSVTTELFNGDAVSLPIPDLHLQDIGNKSNGTSAGEAVRQVVGRLVQQIGASVASHSLHTTTATIQNGVEATSKSIKNLLK